MTFTDDSFNAFFGKKIRHRIAWLHGMPRHDLHIWSKYLDQLSLTFNNSNVVWIPGIVKNTTQLSTLVWWHLFPWISWIFCVTGSLYGISPVTGKFTSQSTVVQSFLWSAPWINGWVNNREAGDLRRHCAHYDITVMFKGTTFCAVSRQNGIIQTQTQTFYWITSGIRFY